jgi:hypothetical protein
MSLASCKEQTNAGNPAQPVTWNGLANFFLKVYSAPIEI